MQPSLFDDNLDENRSLNAPLADRMRPTTLETFIGQEHIVGRGKLLYRMITADKISSIILYGPAGCGKTTLAQIIANTTKSKFVSMNAVTSGVKDIKEVIESAKTQIMLFKNRTILFIDEIHRFNKSQQDALLPSVEDGTLILIGATTENPYFEVNSALISRSTVFSLVSLTALDIRKVIIQALEDKTNGLGIYPINITEKAINFLSNISNGDARVALNALELAFLTTQKDSEGIIQIDEVVASDCVQKRVVQYDKSGDKHYDTISAFIKSLRGSDPDAAIYYLAKMLYAGEDPKFIARRLVIFASEDVSNADPNAITLAVSVFRAVEVIGMPECRINLAQAVTYLATAPKSNSSYTAINKALSDIKNKPTVVIPPHLRGTGFKGAKELGNGVGYKYPHDYENHYVKQEYLPDGFNHTKYYEPDGLGYEKKIIEYMKKIKS